MTENWHFIYPTLYNQNNHFLKFHLHRCLSTVSHQILIIHELKKTAIVSVKRGQISNSYLTQGLSFLMPTETSKSCQWESAEIKGPQCYLRRKCRLSLHILINQECTAICRADNFPPGFSKESYQNIQAKSNRQEWHQAHWWHTGWWFSVPRNSTP